MKTQAKALCRIGLTQKIPSSAAAVLARAALGMPQISHLEGQGEQAEDRQRGGNTHQRHQIVAERHRYRHAEQRAQRGAHAQQRGGRAAAVFRQLVGQRRNDAHVRGHESKGDHQVRQDKVRHSASRDQQHAANGKSERRQQQERPAAAPSRTRPVTERTNQWQPRSG
ncbi:hypothetical protein AAHB37_17850 [Glutamicibacter halophytocola]